MPRSPTPCYPLLRRTARCPSPPWPHHSQVLAYFEAYAERFDLTSAITFRTRVESVSPEGPGHRVRVRHLDGDRESSAVYRAVLVCNGHHWQPKLPSFPGRFDGRWLHSRDYRNSDTLGGKNVLIVGIGNSGADIACDTAPVAGRTLLASRRGAHVIPRHLLGRPTDTFVTPLGSLLPLAVQRAVYGLLLRLERGPQERYGLRRPPTRLLSEHPTLSTDLLPLIRDGQVTPKPDVERLEGDRPGCWPADCGCRSASACGAGSPPTARSSSGATCAPPGTPSRWTSFPTAGV